MIKRGVAQKKKKQRFSAQHIFLEVKGATKKENSFCSPWGKKMREKRSQELGGGKEWKHEKFSNFCFFVDTSIQKGKQRSLAKTLSSFCLDILADGGRIVGK